MYSPPTPTPQDQANKSTRMNQGTGANAKRFNFPILKLVPIRGEEGVCNFSSTLSIITVATRTLVDRLRECYI